MDNQPSPQSSPQPLIDLSLQTMVQVALLGASLGIVSWILTQLIRQIVFVPLFCGDPASSMCVGATGSAGVIALIVTTIVGLLGLVRLGVYRPLLIALASAVSLWGIAIWVGNLLWFEAIAWSIVLFAVSYVVLTWLVRPRAFVLAVGLVIAVVLLARIAAVV